MEAGDEESSMHFRVYCPAFATLRLKYLGRHTFEEANEAAVNDINRLHNFVVSSKRFVSLSGSGNPLLGVFEYHKEPTFTAVPVKYSATFGARINPTT